MQKVSRILVGRKLKKLVMRGLKMFAFAKNNAVGHVLSQSGHIPTRSVHVRPIKINLHKHDIPSMYLYVYLSVNIFFASRRR